MGWPIWLFASCVSTLILVGLVRYMALSRQLLDIPNERSSHSQPIPRGGGLAIVVVFLASLWLLHDATGQKHGLLWGLVGGGGAVALIGLLDDLNNISSKIRFLVHGLAATWLLVWMQGLPAVDFLGESWALGGVGNFLFAIFIVWSINLYNFMDGINGIAAMEAITVCLGGSLLHYWVMPESWGWLIPGLLGAVITGFLPWNFPRAKIFMGDVGSGFLGFVLAALTLHAAWQHERLLWAWIILLGGFVVDATVTLLRRVKRGDKFYQAHRSHAYQYASRCHGSHQLVTLTMGLINLVWLLPMAALVVGGWLPGILGLVVGYLPLVALAYHYKAGDRNGQESNP